MAYIQPNSTVMLLRGVSIDKNYNHTYYFTSEENQYNFFANKVKPNTRYIKPYGENRVVNQSFQFGSQTYQRVNKKTIRLAILADYMYDCNYMMFQNTAYGDKWFYAFIDEINYVNDGATEIVYTIDDMQTWYFDYELGQCFVEREHSETDNIGENIVEENVELGEYIYGNEETTQFSGLYLGGFISTQLINDTSSGHYLILFQNGAQGDSPNGVSNGLYLYGGFPIDDASAAVFNYDTHLSSYIPDPNVQWGMNRLNVILTAIANGEVSGVDEDAVIATFQAPIEMFERNRIRNGSQNGYYDLSPVGEITLPRPTNFKSIVSGETYIPKNNKLLTYPYIKCLATNNQGSINELKFEDFTKLITDNELVARIKWVGTFFPMCTIYAYPQFYKKLDECFDEAISTKNMPVPAWKGNRYGQWLNQHAESANFEIVASGINSLIGGLSGGTLAQTSAGATFFSKVGAQVARVNELKRTPPSAHMQAGNNTLLSSIKGIQIKLQAQTIKAEMARIIDEYFNMFGYATNRVKLPNIRNPQAHIRPHWNYIKTQGCIIHPNQNSGLPADSEDRIAQIYDNGITFWTSSDEVGSYNLDNSPTQGE